MSFLQPALLFGLPIVLLPIVIHLINQRRFQTVPWAAMQFLLAANRISQGYARIRRWLILAARVAAIAGLIFAISRPLSSGLLGSVGGGRIDTAIVLVDRSPSMSQRDSSGISKLDSALRKVVDSLATLQPERILMIDSTNRKPIEVESVDQLLQLPQVSPSGQSADFPAMLQVVNEYVDANLPSRCDVWICSDIRQHDWKVDSGRWAPLRQAFTEKPQPIRFQLISNSTDADDNRSVRVVNAQRIESADGAQLRLSIRIQQANAESQEMIPLQLELNGARSQLEIPSIESDRQAYERTIPIDGTQSRGWGKVSLPPDLQTADNDFYFVYDRPLDRKTLIVADTGLQIQPLEFSASGSSEPGIVCTAQTISPDQFVAYDVSGVALTIWQAPIPPIESPAGVLLDAFAKRGGYILFLPPRTPGESSFGGVSWTEWRESPQSLVTDWVGDQDLLENTNEGDALPLDELKIARHCQISGEFVALAKIDQTSPLLARSMAYSRNVYFCTTTTERENSNLAENGVVLYAIIHRALQQGVAKLGATSMLVAGEIAPSDTERWQQIAGDPSSISSDFHSSPGVYAVDDRLLAINRSSEEDASPVVNDATLAELFQGVDFHHVEVTSADQDSLVQEIWRVCLILMLIALVVEAVLCIPRRAADTDRRSTGASFA